MVLPVHFIKMQMCEQSCSLEKVLSCVVYTDVLRKAGDLLLASASLRW